MNLEDKILSGYAYSIKSPEVVSPGVRKIHLHTGRGGVLLYIEACRKNGISDDEIAKNIICYTDFGPYPVYVLNVKEKDGQI